MQLRTGLILTARSYGSTQRKKVGLNKASGIHVFRIEISDNVVCATSKGSDQPALTRRLIRATASRLIILRLS